MREHIRKFVVGSSYISQEKVNSSTHFEKIRSVWHGELYEDFGIERIFRLFLISAKLLFPGIYLQLLFAKGNYLVKKLIGEGYVLFKTFLPLVVLSSGAFTSHFFQVLNVYLLSETLIYIFNKIYVSEQETGTEHKRSLLLLAFNFIEVVLAYAVLYAGGNYLNHPITSTMDAIYFSTITGATIGYGDLFPITSAGKWLVISQTLTSLSFLVLFFNFFGAKISR
jgi:voltage-gated potassium channel Kch